MVARGAAAVEGLAPPVSVVTRSNNMTHAGTRMTRVGAYMARSGGIG